MYARIATSTGWTFDVIDDLTFPDVFDLVRYWKEMPPAHVCLAHIANALGAIKGDDTVAPTRAPAPAQQKGSLEDLMRMFGTDGSRPGILTI